MHLVRQCYGDESANSVARRLVVPPHRRGGQAQFIEQPMPMTARGSRLFGLIDRVRSNLALPHSLDGLAGEALMSRRTFTRQFRQLTGTTFGEWLQNERLAVTQRRLERRGHFVVAISGFAGFGCLSRCGSTFGERLESRQWHGGKHSRGKITHRMIGRY